MISILCINLKRRMDKRSAFIGAMFAQDVPDDVIGFFDACDAASYDTRDEALRHLRTDFPTVEVADNFGAGTICVLFSYLKCLELIAAYPRESKTILMMDHTVFGVKWREIKGLINRLYNFNVFQIQSIDMPALQSGVEKVYDDDINVGVIGNGMSCMVYTPRGAKMALDLCLDSVFKDAIAETLDKILTHQPRVFSARDSEYWIRRHLNLSKWTGLIDTEREYANFEKGGSDEKAHFNFGRGTLKDQPIGRIGYKWKGWGSKL